MKKLTKLLTKVLLSVKLLVINNYNKKRDNYYGKEYFTSWFCKS